MYGMAHQGRGSYAILKDAPPKLGEAVYVYDMVPHQRSANLRIVTTTLRREAYAASMEPNQRSANLTVVTTTLGREAYATSMEPVMSKEISHYEINIDLS